MLDLDKYKNLLPHPPKSRVPGDMGYILGRARWCEEQNRLDLQFKDDALKDVGLANHPKRDLIYVKAWKDNHAEGYYNVYSHLVDLADFVAQLEAK